MRAHLLSSSDPLPSGVPQVANCGLEIIDPEFVFFFDTSIPANSRAFELLSPLLHCRKCIAAPMNERYLYGMVSRAEMKHGETEAA